MARQYYHTPWILADRCAYQAIASKGKSIYKHDKKCNFQMNFYGFLKKGNAYDGKSYATQENVEKQKNDD